MTRCLAALVLALCHAVCAMGGEIVPSRADLLKAEPEVRKATRGIFDDLGTGRTTRLEAAEAVRIMGSQSADPAEEYLFLQGAFRLFVRAGEYSRAGEVLRHMRSREFPAEALVDLVDRALEPIPRGVDTGDLDEVREVLRDDLARRRRLREESGVTEALERIRVPHGTLDADCSAPEFLERMRGMLRKGGDPVFRYVLRCPMIGGNSDDFPVVPCDPVDLATLAEALSRFCGEGKYAERVHGPLRFLTRTMPIENTCPVRRISFAGNAAETARRMKRIRLGFVAFDGNETIDEAIERLLRAVVDQGRPSERIDFDVILRAPANGQFPRMKTLRGVDTTLFDAFSLVCSENDYKFRIHGISAIISPK